MSTCTTSGAARIHPFGGKTITVGITEFHGMAHEASLEPPVGVKYTTMKTLSKHHGPIRSPIANFMRHFDDSSVDLVEALLAPAITKRPWICSLDCFEAAMAFTILGCPLPKLARRLYLERMFLRDNCKKLVFWSQAAARSLTEYGGVSNERILEKSCVVYPAIRGIPEAGVRRESRQLRLMFSGAFFRKGGMHVVDAFRELRKDYPEATLRLCCDEKIDFVTSNPELKAEYWKKVNETPGITVGRVNRDVLLRDVLPETDIYLLPTYAEAFGFAILEAMAFGIPVIATDVFAIPEIIDHDRTGYLIRTGEFDMNAICRGYVVHDIPRRFRDYMTQEVLRGMRYFADSRDKRSAIGSSARAEVETRFSFRRRNEEMLQIYCDALA